MSWLSDRYQWLVAPWGDHSDLQADVMAIRGAVQLDIPRRFTKLEKLIMATAEALIVALNAATDEVAADLTTLRAELAAAIADKDQAVQDAVNAALAGFDAPIARLQALGADPADPIPAPEPVPPVEEPPADQPA